MVEAFRRLRSDARTWNSGSSARSRYPKGLRKLLDEARSIPGVTHRPFVPRAELSEAIPGVDAVVQPSENENLGSSVLEGICCGVPAIVGPSHGSKDYLGTSSLVFDPYTPESLKSAMARMADALATDRAAMGAEARRRRAISQRPNSHVPAPGRCSRRDRRFLKNQSLSLTTVADRLR